MRMERVLGIYAAVAVAVALVGAVSPSLVLAETPPQFGFSSFSAPLLGVDGAPATQAAGHPYELAASAALNTVVREAPEGFTVPTSVQDLRDVVVDLPLGLVGSAVSAPTCTLHLLSAKGERQENGFSACPEDTIVGYIRTTPKSALNVESPLYNIVPERGVFAEFGFVDGLGDSHALYVSVAPTPVGYALRIENRKLPQVTLTGLTIDVYGDPAARDGSRAQAPEDVPTLTNPADCTGEPLRTTIYMDSWQNPARFNLDGTPADLEEPAWAKATYESPPVTDCAALAGLFNPEIEAGTEQSKADSPTGLEVDLKIPQQEGMGASGTGTPPLKEAVVLLPEGLTIDPASANGLQACSEEQVGISAAGVPNAAAPECPKGPNSEEPSKVGTVEMETPALPGEACKEPGKSLAECEQEEKKENEKSGRRAGVSLKEKAPLTGSVYLATPYENPFGSPEHPGGSMFAIYIVVDDARRGILLKLPAEVRADPATGRLTIALGDAPQFPVSALRLHFFGGSKALLSTPGTCGRYAVSSTLTPWSAPESGSPASASSSFEVTQAVGGGTCTSSVPFAPAFEAGTFGNHAGGYSPLRVTLSRQDSEQDLGRTSITLPPGVLADLASVPLCPEAQATAGTCGEAARIGSATIAAGAGPDPLYLPASGAPPDGIYLTGPYEGAPFGLSIVVPAVAGPFNLGEDGRPVVIRARVSVNPGTGQLEIATDPIPQILGGVPLQIKKISLMIDRPNFIFNSTGCSQSSVTGTVTSAQGASAPISNRFQAADCAGLKFAPELTAVTRANGEFQGHGASLHIAIATGTGTFAAQANMRALKLDLPQRLPARLQTIQSACPERIFDANPAGCPKASVVGSASVDTSILDGTMSGPAYLVSKSGSVTAPPGESKTEKEEAAFPDMVLVLQGEGVKIDLMGALFVNAKNVTSVAFRSIPDVPIRRLDLILPEGKSSILAASSGLCTKRPLTMFTAIGGQNGARVKPKVVVGVSGCRKPRKPKGAKKQRRVAKK